ncbi:RNA polymerase sigma factor [Lipingzhangella sp. LS1_29]|uniref:RNA polymerase sigma factor n=1 Tax=Lipingzhangella rawalii TaxID=2055835 RepID=A0ABU2HA36_9ACTN|nr:RNA polymerase sigma factor [Lipingzhangella rawalii]MDS1272143.1 RNA polymerase sigma factor [Lipingzhangella rawalii]
MNSGTTCVESLASRARMGDEAALDALVRRLHPEVLRRCARFLPCRQDAAEACRQALSRVSRDIHTRADDSSFTPWLYTVVSESARQTYRALREHARQRAQSITGNEVIVPPQDPRTTSVLSGSRIGLLEALDELERERPDLVRPLVLRDLCQVDYEQVARALGLSLGTVKSRIHEGRKHLRRSLSAGERKVATHGVA